MIEPYLKSQLRAGLKGFEGSAHSHSATANGLRHQDPRGAMAEARRPYDFPAVPCAAS
jgi:hypothetical protein